ncbi:MAG: hypothetical protein H6652_01480 [Ardenticatenaceae bacterium]|nr:hypothetical protein [Ardenticatenaceae bacterium]
MKKVLELYGISTYDEDADWEKIVSLQLCPFTNQRCIKIRKSQPDVTIGTCTVSYGRDNMSVMICPNRLLERRQIFLDCIHLLTLHEPGNELHVVQEVAIPGGSVDYFLVSVRDSKVVDFVAIELQTLDTTGTVWPARQTILRERDLDNEYDAGDSRSFGMNWKMTAKTILIQMNHKVHTLENLNKHLVLILQDYLLAYMQREFRFDHIGNARLGDSAHFHIYSLNKQSNSLRLNLISRLSTSADGIAESLGLQADPNVELEQLIATLESKISENTLLQIA